MVKWYVEWERVLLTIYTDSLVIFMIMWGMPAFMIVRSYFKMNTDDRKSVIHDFRTRRFIFTIGLFTFGAFLTHLSTVFPIYIIKGMGIALLSLGGIISVVNIWKESKMKSIGLVILLSLLLFLIIQLQ